MKYALALAISLAAQQVAAHAPVLSTEAKTADAPFVVDNAEHSKAIYAILDGDADYYKIEEDQPFDFYVGLTAAKVGDCPLPQTFDFEVLDANLTRIDGRSGRDFDWWPWFEEFGKQWYWVGPEIGENFASTTVYPAGTYYVRVFNKGNSGKYVLAIGDQERFGIGTILTMFGTIRETERTFWDEAGC